MSIYREVGALHFGIALAIAIHPYGGVPAFLYKSIGLDPVVLALMFVFVGFLMILPNNSPSKFRMQLSLILCYSVFAFIVSFQSVQANTGSLVPPLIYFMLYRVLTRMSERI